MACVPTVMMQGRGPLPYFALRDGTVVGPSVETLEASRREGVVL